MSKIALITGSTGNLGNAVSKKMVETGYSVIGTVEPGKKDYPKNEKVSYKPVDLNDAEAAYSVIQEIIREYGKIDAAICLVGGFGMSTLLKSKPEDFQEMIDLNFYTAFNTVKPILNLTEEKNEIGNIIFVGARPVFDLNAAKTLFPYALSKSMVVKMAEVINTDITNHNFKATVVVPSIIDTPPNRKSMPDADFTKWVTPESIAEKIAFICGDGGKDLRETVLKIYGRS